MGTVRLLIKTGAGLVRSRCLASACCRNFSSLPDDIVQTKINDQTGVATIQLNKKPVNSLDRDMLTQININLEKIENDKSITGAILTSNVPGIFSAGLDIMEFFKTKESLEEFWRTFQETWIKLYGLSVPTVAAINGHAPAGGCLMVLCTDYRIIAKGKYKMGLNETQLGIVAPWWFIETMVNTTGHRVSERAIQLGHMFDTDSALKAGLVDKVVDEADVIAAAEREIATWQKIPAVPRIITKQILRKPLIDKLQAGREADIQNFVEYMTKDSVQKMLHEYMANLRKKAEAKG